MRIEIQAHHLALEAEHREQIQRRASFALSRMSALIRQVDVHLTDVNGPRGGVDTQCRVQVLLDRGEPVVIEDIDHDLIALINRSLARAGQAVDRRISKTNAGRRQHRPQL
jgi:putative sigma-54 modulation protein